MLSHKFTLLFIFKDYALMSFREYLVGILLSSILPVRDKKQKGSTIKPRLQLEHVRLLCNKPGTVITKS